MQLAVNLRIEKSEHTSCQSQPLHRLMKDLLASSCIDRRDTRFRKKVGSLFSVVERDAEPPD